MPRGVRRSGPEPRAAAGRAPPSTPCGARSVPHRASTARRDWWTADAEHLRGAHLTARPRGRGARAEHLTVSIAHGSLTRRPFLCTARRLGHKAPAFLTKGQGKDRGGCSPLRKRPRRRAKQQRALTRKQILILRVWPGLPPGKPDTICSARCVVHAQRCAQP